MIFKTSPSGQRRFWDPVRVGSLILIAGLLAILIGTQVSGYASPITVRFQSGVSPSPDYNGVEDAFLSQTEPERNFGSAASLNVDGNDSVVEGNDLSALLRWDLSAIPPGSTVEQVRIGLKITNSTGKPYPIYALKRGWLPSQVTWKRISSAIEWQQPGATGEKDRDSTVLGYAGQPSEGAQSITLNTEGIAVVQHWIDDPSANFGLVIHDTQLEDGLAFASSEAANPADRPSLTVIYRPPFSQANGSSLRSNQTPMKRPQQPIGAMPEPKYMILMIGDGMGAGIIEAAGMYANGSGGSLSFEQLPNRAEMTTRSANDRVTDSAASATAMATGQKVNNGVISMSIPGDGSELPTLLEAYRDNGKRTGLVTTSFMTDATPAAFGAHVPSRYSSKAIASAYLTQTRPNVLLGGGGNGLTPDAARQAGYTVAEDRAQLQSIDLNRTEYLSGQFGDAEIPYEDNGVGSLPHLSEMTRAALGLLEKDPDGFFLMVEGGNIDHAEHGDELELAIGEVLEFDRTVKVVMDWAASHPGALVVVTADHETGGLQVIKNNGKGSYPSVKWATRDHTAANVPIYAWGVNANRVRETLDNTDIFNLGGRAHFASPKSNRPAPGENFALLNTLLLIRPDGAPAFP